MFHLYYSWIVYFPLILWASTWDDSHFLLGECLSYFLPVGVRWFCSINIRLCKGESQIVWILHVCRLILTQDIKCMHTCQAASYPKRLFRQQVNHLTPLLSLETSYMYNEVVLIDRSTKCFSWYNGVT